MIKTHPIKSMLLIAMPIILILGSLSPIPQDNTYHHFADGRTILFISNFWNVISNLPFFFVGIYALDALFKTHRLCYHKEMKSAYILFFLGIALVSLGSGYYHLNPNNDTLLWDRLPMAVAFMALFSIVITEFVGVKEGKYTLYPLLFLGLLSVIYWAYTESIGQGDLRIYLFVQFFPMIIIPLLLWKFRPSFTLYRAYWSLLLCYLLAKLCEHFDEALYGLLSVISGHSLKHLFASLGLFLLVRSFICRKFECKL